MPDGDWVGVPYVPGSFAVKSGDMMQRWTNHRFKSTPHRALPPVGRPRYAIPYFMGPHLDTEIACLPTCHGPSNPPRHPPSPTRPTSIGGTTPTTTPRASGPGPDPSRRSHGPSGTC